MSYETNDKMVSHPDHYRSGRYEVIDIIDEFTKDLRGTEAVCTANAIKYILRWKKKNGIQDVQKAIWYLQHMVDKEEERLREEAVEYDGPDEHCRTCKFRFNTPENDKICLNCFGREKYVRDEAFEEKVTSLNKTTYSKEVVDKALNHIRENSIYGIFKEKKLEPGCDKCEISECKFLEDPFMNPPYNELLDQWKAQKEIINDLLREKKEMQDSIDILTNKENLIIKPQFPIKPENADKVYKKLIEQMETGVILLPHGYEVVIAPKEIDVKLDSSKKDEELDEYIDKLQRSTAICMNLDWIREYIKMNCPEESEGRDYILAMLETWRVSMMED